MAKPKEKAPKDDDKVKIEYDRVAALDVKVGDFITTSGDGNEHYVYSDAEKVIKIESVLNHPYKEFTLKRSDGSEYVDTFCVAVDKMDYVVRFKKLKLKKWQEVVVIRKEEPSISVQLFSIVRLILGILLGGFIFFMVLLFAIETALNADRDHRQYSAIATPPATATSTEQPTPAPIAISRKPITYKK